MKNRIQYALFLIAISIHVNAIDVKPQINNVTVYPSGASIECSASSSLVSGENLIRFYGISRSINSQSIQLGCSKQVLIQSIRYYVDYLKPIEKTARMAALEDSILLLGRLTENLGASKKALAERINFLQANKKLPDNNSTTYAADLEKLNAVLEKNMNDVFLTQLKYDRKQARLNERAIKVRRQIAEEKGHTPSPEGIIEVSIRSIDAGKADFNITYFDYSASWRPVYDFRYIEADKPIATGYNAVVTQTTGIDWVNVKLSLSANNPIQDNNKPELNPWYLRYLIYRAKEKNMSYGYELKQRESISDSARKDNDFEPNQATTLADFTTQMENALSVEFQIDSKTTILSDGKENLLNIGNYEIPSNFQYYAVPKLDKEAFLIANITSWENYHFLPGTINLYMGNTFIGQSFLETNVLNDTMTISFGRDKMVVIERTKLSSECKTSIIGTKQTHNFTYELKIRNGHNSAIEIILADQIPLSNNAEIEVELQDKNGARYVATTGLLEWKLKVEPAKTEAVKFKYQVKHPKNKPLDNL